MTETPDRKRLRHALVTGFLFAQLAIPASYYVRDDPYDERFAWRMFSPTRMVRCQVAFTSEQNGRRTPVALQREVGQTWRGWMQRGHVRVVRGFGRDWCARNDTSAAPPRLFVDMRCAMPNGRPATSIAISSRRSPTVAMNRFWMKWNPFCNLPVRPPTTWPTMS